MFFENVIVQVTELKNYFRILEKQNNKNKIDILLFDFMKLFSIANWMFSKIVNTASLLSYVSL